jgi:hypothetical protein
MIGKKHFVLALNFLLVLMVWFTVSLRPFTDFFDLQAPQTSWRRQNYEQLLNGDYYAGELQAKFYELFGDGYSPQDIRDHYTEIFDISPEEVDEGIIGLLSLDAVNTPPTDLDWISHPPPDDDWPVPEEVDPPDAEPIFVDPTYDETALESGSFGETYPAGASTATDSSPSAGA